LFTRAFGFFHGIFLVFFKLKNRVFCGGVDWTGFWGAVDVGRFALVFLCMCNRDFFFSALWMFSKRKDKASTHSSRGAD
jgi:hypothetical protein